MIPIKSATPIRDGWLDYAKAIFTDPPYHPDQVRETKKAFFSGCQFMLTHMMSVEEDASDEVLALNLSLLESELDAFCSDVKEGRA